MNTHSRRCIAVIGLALMCALPAAAQTKYKFEPIPVSPAGISNTGLITNVWSNAFDWDPDLQIAFGTLFRNDGSTTTIFDPSWPATVPTAVLNDGTAIGSVSDLDLTVSAGSIRTPDGRYIAYQAPGSSYTVFQTGNELGSILGYYFDADFNFFQFLLRKDGTLTNLVIPGFEGAFWNGLNNAGTLVGSQYDPSAGGAVGVIANGNAVQSFVVPGATDTYANAINNRGDVAGTFDIVTPFPHYTFTEHGFVRDSKGLLTTLDYHFDFPPPDTSGFPNVIASGVSDAGTEVSGINDRGQVLGVDRAFYFVVYSPYPGSIWVAGWDDTRSFIATPMEVGH